MAIDLDGYMAAAYDIAFEPVLGHARRLGLQLHRPKPGALVLDIGCGTGSQLALYQGLGCSLAGIDPAPGMVARAGQKLGAAARIHLGSARAIPYPDASVDLALFSMMLHALPPATRQDVIAESKRVLKADGRILVLDYHPGPLTVPRGWAGKPLIHAVEWMAGREHFTSYREFLAAGGLPAVAQRHDLVIDTARVIKGGNFGLFLLRLPGRP
jgi:ubiquinone/menaquinone biosynthesis C-methylase UbiE